MEFLAIIPPRNPKQVRKIPLRLEKKQKEYLKHLKKYFLIFIYSKLPLLYPNNYHKEQFCSFSIGYNFK